MNNQPKLLSLVFANGDTMTLNPTAILAALPCPQNLMQTQIAYIGGQALVAKPYTQFIRLWDASLQGRDIIEQV